MSKPAQIIPVSSYPQLVNNADAASIARALRGLPVIERGNQVIEQQSEMLCAAVLELADQLEQAGKDIDAVLLAAHEIRGLAGSAGLTAAGRIADGLCRYCDEIDRLGLAPDRAIVDLHVGAILRASRIPAERGAVGDAVAKELAALVSHKLTEIKSIFS